MAFERTQHQTSNELKKAAELSLEPARPPAKIPGYQLLKFLGRGAYGEVWSANDLKTGRRVAIKFYTRRSAADVQLLASEVEKLVVLAADRYVVQLLDVGWNADPPYYVMDYLEHGSLEDRMLAQPGMSVHAAIDLFQELATGMMHLHGKGILHCDLKPGNVLLDQDGNPRVADFGQSRLSTDETAALGTLFYMAPEQADLDAAPDAKWDVYGLGALLFSMLTGKPPYYSVERSHDINSAEDLPARLARYRESLNAADKPIEHRNVQGVDRALADIIDRCIAADPQKRFNNIQSLLLALRQRELTKARRPLMVLGLLGPLLLVGIMSLFGWWAFRQAVYKTQLEITNKAVESNRFAAKLAARSAAEQIDEYFRVVEQLSRDEKEFLPVFDRVMADKELRDLRIAIADPNSNSIDYEDPNAGGAEIVKARETLRKHALRQQLQPFLETRLKNESGEYPIAASWFICDRYGNQIASAFRKQNLTLGKNYSYRTYFTGLDRDLKALEFDDASRTGSATADDASPTPGSSYRVAKNLDQRQIIGQLHLSAVFISEQSNTWKVAFAAPLIRQGTVQGIVAVTVDLGSFIDFENVPNHYVMMVDARAGDNPGIIVEHPLFKKVLEKQGRIPDELARCTVDVENVTEKKRLTDPVGGTEFGKSQKYNREMLVASAPVRMRSPLSENDEQKSANEKPDRIDTGFVVLAVEDADRVVEPANDLSRQLTRLAALAALFLLGVTVGMWLFVKRMLQESRRRLERTFSPASESTARPSQETVAVADYEKTS